MNLEPFVEGVRAQLEVAAEAGGDDARDLARRLVAPLEASVRLALQDALSTAAEEITLELAPGSVELRLRGREPEFVVSLPPAEASGEGLAEGEDLPAGVWLEPGPGPGNGAEGEETSVSRINLRLPDRLKTRVEQAARGQGLSVNAWLVRAAAGALDRAEGVRRQQRRAPHGAERYTGWARS